MKYKFYIMGIYHEPNFSSCRMVAKLPKMRKHRCVAV